MARITLIQYTLRHITSVIKQSRKIQYHPSSMMILDWYRKNHCMTNPIEFPFNSETDNLRKTLYIMAYERSEILIKKFDDFNHRMSFHVFNGDEHVCQLSIIPHKFENAGKKNKKFIEMVMENLAKYERNEPYSSHVDFTRMEKS